MSDDDPTEPIPGWPTPPVPGPAATPGTPATGSPVTPPAYPPPSYPPPAGLPAAPPAAPPPGGYGAPGAPPYGAPPAGGYGPPPGYGYGYQGGYGYGMSRDHPDGTTVLILGILAWVLCGLCAPFAWVMGNRVLGEIDRNPAAYSNRSAVQIGRILGMVYCILVIVSVVFVLALVVIGLIAGASS